MYLLAGLLGMMVLGSLVIIGTRGMEARVPVLPPAPPDRGDGPRPSLFARLGLAGAGAAARQASFLADYDPAEDQLVIIYDDSLGGEPGFEMRLNPDDPTVTDFLVDGVLVLSMPTAQVPMPRAIALLGESAAAALGLG
ncbi:hypothetical protein [Thetidibacter halocola]|nr:hypothetical protein [Thetidibacter halocola]